MSHIAFKIVEQHGDQMKALFHGIEGSRILPPKKWLKATEKMVVDGGRSRKYLSGFHIFMSRWDAEVYLEKSFTKRKELLKVVRCLAMRPRRKWHSKSPIWLAPEILIEK